MPIRDPNITKHWRHSPEHGVIKTWVLDVLSEQNRRFRIRCLAEAFGLGEELTREFIFEFVSFGPHLQAEMAIWTQDHPNLNLNNAEFEIHPLGNVRTD